MNIYKTHTQMKNYLKLLWSVCLLCSCFAMGQIQAQCGNLYIATVVDGPLSGGTPKGVQLCAAGAIADLSIYGFGSANNGGGTDGAEFTGMTGALAAGSCIWIASESAEFMNYFGFAPDYTTGSVGINGDDAVEIFCDPTMDGDFTDAVVEDVFGDINTDGSGECWEYADGFATNSNSAPNNGIFSCADYTFSGVDALDGCTDDATCTNSIFGSATVCAIVVDVAAIASTCDTGANAVDTSDDTFTVSTTVTVTNGSGMYVITDGTSTWGPFASGSSGSVTFPANGSTTTGVLTAVDMVDGTCSVALGDFGPVSSCSTPACDLTSVDNLSVTCDDNGTVMDASDDTFTLCFEITGSGLYIVEDGTGAQVNALLSDGSSTGASVATGSLYCFGPFVADGTMTALGLVGVDNDDPSCTIMIGDFGSASCSNSGVCSLDNLTATPSVCNSDGTYDLTLCFAQSSPLSANFIATINGTDLAPMAYSSLDALGCFTLSSYAIGNGVTGISASVRDMMSGSGGGGSACDGQLYIVSSEGTGDGMCDVDGEFIEIGYVDCSGCTEAIDLAGYLIEDSVSGAAGTQPSSISITSGSLLPGETLVIYSGYLDGTITSVPTGSMGSNFVIGSPRSACPIWNGGGDTATLLDPSGAVVDSEATVSGASTYTAPNPICSSGGSTTCESAVVVFNEPDCGIAAACIPPTFTAFATCNDGVNQAGLFEYYIAVEVSNTGGVGYPINATVDVGTGPITMAATSATSVVYFGPFNHSTAGGSQNFAAVIVGDLFGCNALSVEPETVCGISVDADGDSDGSADTQLHGSGPWCDCGNADDDGNGAGNLIAQADPSMFSGGPANVQLYVLTDASGVVLAFNQTGVFQTLDDGTYEVFAVNYSVLFDAIVQAYLPSIIGINITAVLGFLNDAANAVDCLDICGPASYTLSCACFVCPEVAMLDVPSPLCAGECFDITASMFSNIDLGDNNGADFQFLFGFYSGGLPAGFADPYTTAPDGLFNGGVSIMEDLAGGTATLTCMGGSLTAGDYTIVVYLDPAANTFEAACNPFASVDITINGLSGAPDIPEPNILTCVGGDTEISLTPPSGALPYLQDFNADEGAGAIGVCATADLASCTSNLPGSDWTIDGDFSGLFDANDYFMVNNGALSAQDSDFEVCFTSALIDISGYTGVNFGVDITETGDHENLDYVNVSYLIDGVPTLITNWMNAGTATNTLVGDLALGGAIDDADWGSTTVSASGLSGSTLQIQICLVNNAGTENISIDNLTVSGTSCTYNFYQGDPATGASVEASGFNYDPVTTVAQSPQTIWVTCVDQNGCESPASTVEIIVQGDVPLVCNDDIQISLGSNCTLDVGPDLVLEGDVDLLLYEVEITDQNGNLISALNESHLGQLLMYSITNVCSGNSCWGQITLEDKILPTADTCDCSEESFQTFVADPANDLADWPCVYWCGENNSFLDPSSANSIIPVFSDNCATVANENISLVSFGSTSMGCLVNAHRYGWVFSNGSGDHNDGSMLCQQVIIEMPIDPNAIIKPQNVELTCAQLGGNFDNLAPSDIMNAVAENIDPGDLAGNGNAEGIPFAWPHFISDGIAFSVNNTDTECNLSAIWEDTDLGALCPSLVKKLRRFSVLDWCNGSLIEVSHLINVVDEIAPVWDTEFPLQDVSVGIQPWTCAASFEIPGPEHLPTDDCSNVSVLARVLGANGPLNTYQPVGTIITGIPIGSYGMQYIARDDCGNSSMQTVALTVSDNVPPVPVCEDEINLSLTPDDINFEDGGIAKIFAENLNIGSHDSGCGEVWFKLVRQEELFDAPNGFWNDSGENGAPDYNQPPRGKFFPPYACDGANTDDFPDVIRFDEKGDLEFIPTFDQVFFDDDAKFCCDDVGTEIMVVLRVFDVDPGEGSVDPRRMIGYESGIENFDAITPDLFGHFNDCLVKVNVELKLAPIVNCPDDVTVNCLDNTSVDDLGMGSVVNLCGSIDIGYVDANNTIDPSCGNGVIARSWFADYDGDGVVSSVAEQQHQCIQYITVDASSTFKPWTIKFPMNVAGESALGYTRECTENGYVTLAGDVFGITSQEENVITEQRGYECTDVPEQCIPEWDSGSCGLVGYTLDVDTFYFEKDACMKILNHWTVIDWCTWLPNSGDDIDTDDVGDLADINADLFGIENEGDPVDSPNFDLLAPFSDWSLGVCAGSSCFESDNNSYISYALFPNDIDGNGVIDFVDQNGDGAITQVDQIISQDQVLAGVEGYLPLVDQDGFYTYTQIIKVINDTPPVLLSCEEGIAETNTNCLAELVISNMGTDSEECSSDWLKWEVVVMDAQWNILSTFELVSGNNEEVVINVSDEIGELGFGTYRVNWKLRDGCGNKTECIQDYVVKDVIAPTPLCITSLSTAVMGNDGTVTIWASDYNVKSSDNCSDESDLRYSFSGEDFQPSFTITCEDMSNGIFEFFQLEMWVWDEADNRDHCFITLRVDDNQEVCTDNVGGALAEINGDIMTEFGDMVENTQVTLNANLPEYPNSTITASDGLYAFASNPMSQDYQISANRNDDHLNGVSTLDLVLIQKHILGLSQLDSPYKVIAADINSSESLSAADLVELRKLILGIYDELPNNTSWRFVDESELFNDIFNPWPFREILEVDQLSTDMMEENFIGVKIGDVSGNAVANSFVNTEIRRGGSLTFEYDERVVKEGQIIQVPISANNFEEVLGFQFTLAHEGMRINSIIPGSIELSDNNVGVRDNMSSFSWNTIIPKSSDEVLFTLEFTVLKSGKLSQILFLTDRITISEAYMTSAIEVFQVNMKPSNESAQQVSFTLFQNKPNPFKDETMIAFILPQDGNASISFYSVEGKSVGYLKVNGKKGYNEVTINKDQLPLSGILYYQLESGSFSAIQKMVLIE